MTGDQEYKQITYFYREKERTAKVLVRTVPAQGAFYYFSMKNEPPLQFIKKGDEWFFGSRPLTDELERADLWKVLAAAIDDQIINK